MFDMALAILTLTWVIVMCLGSGEALRTAGEKRPFNFIARFGHWIDGSLTRWTGRVLTLLWPLASMIFTSYLWATICIGLFWVLWAMMAGVYHGVRDLNRA